MSQETLNKEQKTVTIEQLEQAVQAIEEGIFEQTGIDYFNLTVRTNGFCQIVDFIGIELWSSENDMREYSSPEEDTYESIEKFLRRELMNNLKVLHKINV